ncbi:AAA family ATPase [Photobacterium galatheae]|uniref:HTH cro/C1-type domain-containing protein n=1 Tax=Photobacterium galatheae TaxID=1654360 RepID=A0A066RRR2_9GAMM|nr:AAA family ATPase [Photobacterium galatheae]KDM90377.1 hypothetical protein EA58_16740 [Photobacterium galatheae]MCM0147904.1 AAA family ATPase [Photobacterium galatheae]
MGPKDGRIPLNVSFLKTLRKRCGLSQEKVAEQCLEKGLYVSVSSIKRAESGMNVLYRTAMSLADFYAVPVGQLLADATPVATGTLSKLPFYDRQLLTVVLEMKALTQKAQVEALMDGTHTHCCHQDNVIALGWCVHESDEYVFERIRRLCAMLQFTFKSEIRLFVEAASVGQDGESKWMTGADATDFMVSDRMMAILSRISWGDIVACPCFVSSNCARPKGEFAPEDVRFAHWRVVSMCQVNTDYFVGRTHELERLQNGVRLFTETQTGMGYCLSGMAGIGKTRLLLKTLEYAECLGCRVTQVQLLNYGIVDTRSPLTLLVRALFECDKEDADDVIRGRISVSAIPSSHHLFLYWLMGVTLRDSEKKLLDLMEFQALQQAVEQSLTDLIQVRCDMPFRIIAVEDIHWADQVFMGVIQVLSKHARESNFLLLLTFRQQNQLAVKQAWLDEVEVIELSSLSEEESYQLAQYMAPEQDEMIQHCVELAQGHPLFLRQTLLCSRLDHEIPESLEHLVMVQLNQLDETDLSAVKSASVFGQCFDLEQLRFVIGVPDYEPDKLLELGLVKPVNHQLMFHHDLICHAIHHQLTEPELIEVNQRCAAWYESRDKQQHALHAKRARDENAFGILVDAARSYLDNFQFEKALNLIEEALDIAPETDQAFTLNFKGNCLYAMGRLEESIHALEQAVTCLCRDQEKSQYYLDLVRPYRLTDETEKALTILDLAQAFAEQTQQYVLLSEVHSMRGNMLFPSGDVAACEVEHQQALAYSQQAGSRVAIAKSFGGLGDCAYAQGKMTTAYQYLQECLSICEQEELLSIEAVNRYMLATVMIYQLRSGQALQHAQQASTLAYLTANRRAEIVSRLTSGWIFLDRQALVQAENEIETALRIAEQLKASRFIAFLLESKARLYWQKGEVAAAEHAIDQGLALVNEHQLSRFIGPWLCATKAFVSQSEAVAMAALAQGEAWLESACVGHNYLRFYQQGIQAAWRLKKPSLLRRYRKGLAAFATAEPNPWCDFYVEQADLMLALIRNEASVANLLKFNQYAETVALPGAIIPLTELNNLLSH